MVEAFAANAAQKANEASKAHKETKRKKEIPKVNTTMRANAAPGALQFSAAMAAPKALEALAVVTALEHRNFPLDQKVQNGESAEANHFLSVRRSKRKSIR